MLGLLVSEFVNMVEAHHGATVADQILFGTEAPSGHDTDLLNPYPAAQLQVLFGALSRRVGESPHALLQVLAGRVIGRIRLVNPDVFARHADLFGQIAIRSEDRVLPSYDIDETEAEEIALLLGDRAQAECLVHGLLADLTRYERGRMSGRRHAGRKAPAAVRPWMR